MEASQNSQIGKINSTIKESIEELFKSRKDFGKPEENFIGYLNKILGEFIDTCCLSILGGEYVFNKDYRKELENFKEFINNISNNELNDSSNIEWEAYSDIQFENSNILNRFTEPIIYVSNIICDFITKIDLSYLDHEIVHQRFTEDVEISLSNINSFKQTTKDMIEPIWFNIRLSYIDHTLFYKDHLKILYKIKDYIGKSNDFKNQKYISLVTIDKCNILINKICIRAKLEDDKLYINENFNENEVPFNEIKYYTDFYDKAKLYSGITDSTKLNNKAKEIINKEDYSYEDLYILTHYYKNYKKDSSKLEEICNTINNKIVPEEFLFDKNAYNICKNYTYNNLFSLNLKLKKFDFRNSEQDFNDIVNINQDNDCSSYYPYYKYLKYLNKQIGTSEDINLLTDILKRQTELLKILKEKHYKFYKSNFLIYQLPKEECIIKTENITLFLASSFIIPNDYNKEKKEIYKIEDSIYSKYLNQFSKHSNNINNQLENAKRELEKTKKEFEKSNIRNIELISIFTAIISLIIGGSSILKNTNMNEAIFSFITIFSCIALFIGLIIALTKTYCKNYFNKSICFIVILFSLSYPTYHIYSHDSKVKVSETIKDKKIKVSKNVNNKKTKLKKEIKIPLNNN